MHAVLNLLALALLAFSVRAVMKDRCPWAVGKFPFDAEKFAGSWNVIACVGNEDYTEETCPKYNLVHYNSGNDVGFNLKYTAMGKDGKELTYEGYSRTYKADKPSMFLGVWKKSDESKYDGIYKQTLIATDYDNYAIYIACKPEFNATTKAFGRKLEASILGRKPTINEDVKKTLVNVLSGYDIDIANVKMVDHSGCTE